MKSVFLVTLMCMLVASVSFAVVGGGDVTIKAKKAGDVVFSHEIHVAGAGLKCTDCHDSLYITSEKHKPVTMAEMQKGKSCGACHNGKVAFSVKANCKNCHKK